MKKLIFILVVLLGFTACSDRTSTERCNVYDLEYSTVKQAEDTFAKDSTITHVVIKEGTYEYLIIPDNKDIIVERRWNMEEIFGYGVILGTVIGIVLFLIIAAIIEQQ